MSSTSFDVALAFTLQSEGGWSDDPADPGGATMKGITIGTFRGHFPGATIDQLRNITDEQVADIYRHGYWNAVKGDDLPIGVDLSAFDFAVNAGPGRSIRLLQHAVGAVADGLIGPQTMRDIEQLDPGDIVSELGRQQQAYYESLPTFGRFGHGWTRRTAERGAAAMRLLTPSMVV